MIARKAILDELKRRYQSKDPNVMALNEDNRHRWYHPQENYFSGHGVMKCPICANGMLKYSRSGYNGHVHACCSSTHCMNWME